MSGACACACNGAPAPRLRLGLAGIACHRDAQAGLSPAARAVLAARESLADTRHAPQVDAVVIAGATLLAQANGDEMLDALGLHGVPVVGVAMAGALTHAGALRVARSLMVAEGLRRVLVIVAGDATLSFVATAGDAAYEVLAMTHAVEHDALSGWRDVLERALVAADVALGGLDATFLATTHAPPVADLAASLGLPASRAFAAEHFAGLHEHPAARAARAGANLLLIGRAGSHHSAIVCRKR